MRIAIVDDESLFVWIYGIYWSLKAMKCRGRLQWNRSDSIMQRSSS